MAEIRSIDELIVKSEEIVQAKKNVDNFVRQFDEILQKTLNELAVIVEDNRDVSDKRNDYYIDSPEAGEHLNAARKAYESSIHMREALLKIRPMIEDARRQ